MQLSQWTVPGSYSTNNAENVFVNLKSNLAHKSNKGHNLLESVFPQIMSNKKNINFKQDL